MHFGGAALLILALASAQVPRPQHVDALTASMLMVAFASSVTCFACALTGWTATNIRRQPSNVRRWLKEYGQWRNVHTTLWILCGSASVLWIGWPSNVMQAASDSSLPLVGELAIIAVVLLPMFASYAAYYEVDRVANWAFGPTLHAVEQRRWDYASWHMRHQFGSVVVILTCLILADDAFAAVEGPSTYTSVGSWAIGLTCIALVVLYPRILCTTWSTYRMPAGPLRDAIGEEFDQTGRRFPKICVWNTHGRIVNALIVGLLPGTQRLLISDAVLKHFSTDEVLAIVRHEAGHFRHHHVGWRIVALVPPAIGIALLFEASLFWPASSLPAEFAQGQLWAWAIALVVIASYLRWAFETFCKLLEHEADLENLAVSTDASSHEYARNGTSRLSSPHFSAAQSSLVKLALIHGFDRKSWLHPTTRRRIRLLRCMWRCEAMKRRFVRRVNRLKLAIAIGTALSAVALTMVRFGS